MDEKLHQVNKIIESIYTYYFGSSVEYYFSNPEIKTAVSKNNMIKATKKTLSFIKKQIKKLGYEDYMNAANILINLSEFKGAYKEDDILPYLSHDDIVFYYRDDLSNTNFLSNPLTKIIAFCLLKAEIENQLIELDEEIIRNTTFTTTNNQPKKENIIIKIESLLSEIDRKKGWESIFFEEKDYLEYRDILVNFFSDPNFNIPQSTIITKNRTITKLSILFKGIHEHFSEMRGHLLKDERFHQVTRILHEWKDKNSVQIYKAIYKG